MGPLTPGTRIGPYEVQSALGAGGMGEVYRAHDSRLNRDVALKVLPEVFRADPDRLARFTREAQVLASLNHPNIAAIYGVESGPAEAGHYVLVLELVEGPTLADRIAAGPIALDEALPIARQIADALEAAHDQGVVHRDLKPANVKLRPDGTVKVLDFGLAKAMDPAVVGATHASPALDVTASPTITTPAATGVGVVLGTAAYMAPEQARGRVVDKRADIWAFGCVLFEMLSGARPFSGEDVAETLGAVIHKEPDWNRLPAETPGYLRTLMHRCLQKDPRKRLPHIGVARLEIDEAPPGSASGIDPAPAGRRHNVRLAWTTAAVAIVAFLIMAAVALMPTPAPDPPVARASILPPPDTRWAQGAATNRFTLSPDGSKLAFIGTSGAIQRLWIRSIDALTSQPLAGTEGVVTAAWSPDSRFIVFVAGGRLRKIDAAGGSPTTLADKAANIMPTCQLVTGRPVVAYNNQGSGGASDQNLWTVTLTGDGKPAIFLQTSFAELRPRFSPDGRWVAYESNESGRSEVYITTFPDRKVKWQVSAEGGRFPRWRRDGRELFYLAPDNTLMAAPLEGPGTALKVGNVQSLFEVNPRLTTYRGYIGYAYDVSADGQRFVINKRLEETSEDPLTLLVNWPALLRR